MTNFARLAELVDAENFAGLFIEELGWDNPTDTRPVRYTDPESGQNFSAVPVASKRGVVVYHVSQVLDRVTLEALDRHVADRSAERLLILSDGVAQQWRWPEPRKAGGTRYVTHHHTSGAPNPALLQRLAAVQFSIDEEPTLTVLEVRERVRAQFNADAVTVRFYDEFRSNQQSLMNDIEGIGPQDERSWYSSLLLNRLMFIYFMQRKEFLNGDQNYLRNSLRAVRALQGPDRFYDFYRDFLIPLFHEGLGSDHTPRVSPELAGVLGDVPYVNGGIFALHPLEEEYEIRVPDETFEKIFDFFDRYRWHLDERPTGNPEEINPEVLGYIFEKYVNQKEQGAYYTKEDVTGYMSSMAILPVVIDRVTNHIGTGPWALLQAHPHRYLPEGLVYGLEAELPDVVGSADLTEVGPMDELAGAEYGLPGERWREVRARRTWALELVNAIERGDVGTTGQAVTANLNLQALMLDWIAELDDPSHVAATWDALSALKVVDPTCGSGAFLFAALDLLEELYDATLTQAEKLHAGAASDDVAKILAEVAAHASREYFLMKRTVLSNLYGVDLMPEATEIARLRLFLAMVARLNDRAEVEPLPDLDMNIRAGNLLVGCSTLQDARDRFHSSLLAIAQLDSIAQKSGETAAVYREFVEAQRDGLSADEVNGLKREFTQRTAQLREELDLLYSPHERPGPTFEAWRESHRPFHWFVEFPEVMLNGGFDCVIGNPPYVAKSKVTTYSYSGFATDAAPDIFAPCMERAAGLVAPGGSFSMIVPISFQFSDRYAIARRVVASQLPRRWVSTYSRNPAALFDAGLGVRSTIVIGARHPSPMLATTELRRWREDARPYLFDLNRYEAIELADQGAPWPRLGHPEIGELYRALTSEGASVGQAATRRGV